MVDQPIKNIQTCHEGSFSGQAEPQNYQRNIIRHPDANVLQRLASHPTSSVWVGASAGTGKTKVLTDRVLRLLLPISKDIAGTPPHKILCLTYTKAAANEMALRIGGTLAEWAIMPETLPDNAHDPDKSLYRTLEKLQGRAPYDYEISAARALFAQVIDTPGGIRIMTIHSFCQSILGRFPIEAGIRPGQSILDDASTNALIDRAQSTVFKRSLQENAGQSAQALDHLARYINADQFSKLLKALLNERSQMKAILEKNWGVDGLYSKLCQLLEIQENLNSRTLTAEFCNDENLPIANLRQIVRVMAESKNITDNKLSDILSIWINMDADDRANNIDAIKEVLETSSGGTRKDIMTKSLAKEYPDLNHVIRDFQNKYFALHEKLNKVQCAALTRDLFFLGDKIVKTYQDLKTTQGGLDYDDLITLTYRLLHGDTAHGSIENMPGWVHYKLDQGLDHILIDEAQDTNPEQWKIIKALTQDFFTGQSEKNNQSRTLFTVGDEKQSIYSFQRASPEEFDKMRTSYALELKNVESELQDISLQTSFRSTPSVLQAVDLVFSLPELCQDPGFAEIKHSAHRSGQAGEVTLWPIFEPDKSDREYDPWEPPVTLSSQQSASSQCAAFIAKKIHHWIISGEKLESHNRAVQAGDIMVLVRTRTAFVNQLIRELKALDIPVAGHDRMVLNNQLAVQDILALCEFSLLPDDDLTLACLLKSPLIGFDEQQIYDLSIHRAPKSLWERLCANPDFDNVRKYLESFIILAGAIRPYEFLSRALSEQTPVYKVTGMSAFKSRLGEDCIDPLDELLAASLNFEQDHTPTLQGFVHWQKTGHTEIKREMEEAGDSVRIMTIHGSKGLQAPIVIMPDTTKSQRKNSLDAGANLLWPQKTGLDIPLWAPRKSMAYDIYNLASDKIDFKSKQEDKRLLYVAMTRAEDRLYVTGYKNNTNKLPDECWYNLIKKSLENETTIVRNDDGSLTLLNRQEKKADRKPKKTDKDHETVDEPYWLFKNAPEEPSPPRPLVPSRPSQNEPAALSPLKADMHSRFRRGNITHKLLQFLPDIAPSLRQETAHAFLLRFAHDLSPNTRDNIQAECLAILNDVQFAPIFALGSRAEVPITGLLKGKDLVSGQIDRLAISDNDVWIIDYKTNRPPPLHIKDIPPVYINQLRTYRDVLHEIYPLHRIHCALIWTDGPQLMPVNLD